MVLGDKMIKATAFAAFLLITTTIGCSAEEETADKRLIQQITSIADTQINVRHCAQDIQTVSDFLAAWIFLSLEPDSEVVFDSECGARGEDMCSLSFSGKTTGQSWTRFLFFTVDDNQTVQKDSLECVDVP
jgi:hypothetical protein